MCLLAEPSLAQLQRTLTVDPSGNADFTTIQGAIDSIADDPADKWTILLYAGVYDEAVTLDGTQENIDLIGVDRDACIIAPTGTGENGVTITSGTETSRHNTIRNITIRTTDGHGIEIVKGGGGLDVTPRDITIEDCVVEADGEGMDGITGDDSVRVRIEHCVVVSDEDTGVWPGSDWELSNSTVRALGNGSATPHGIDIQGNDGLVVTSCEIFSEENALRLGSTPAPATNCRFTNSFVHSGAVGGPFQATVTFLHAKDIIFANCIITNDSSFGTLAEATALFSDATGGDNVRLVNCLIQCDGGEETEIAIGFKHDNGGAFYFDTCVFVVFNAEDPSDLSKKSAAVGIQSNRQDSTARVLVTGGSISSRSARERETEVYDISFLDQLIGPVFVSGLRLTKWNFPVSSSGRALSIVQRVLSVSPAVDNAVMAATALTAAEQSVTIGITNPDVYRVLTAKGSAGVGTDKVVYVIGTNFAGDAIADAITLSDASVVQGTKPFQTVTKIILPASAPGNTVSIGTSNALGMQFPIDDVGDVLQLSRKAATETAYTVLNFLPGVAVGVNHSTFTPPSITAGDSFELVVLSSQ